MKKTTAAELRIRTGLAIGERGISSASSAGLLMLTMLCLAPVSHAGTIFQTGFESSDVPAYSTGQLSGNNGWIGTAAAVVENSTVFSGSQALSLNSTGLTMQSLIGHNLTYDSSSDPDQTVVFDVEFMESSSGSRSNWNPLNVGANGLVIAQIVVQTNGDAVLGLLGPAVGSIPVSTGTWNDFRLVLDFQTQTVTGYVNSQLLGSGTFANPTTVLGRVNIGLNSAPGGDTGYFDQLSITSVPEPGYAGLVAAGFVLIAVRASALKLRRVALLPTGLAMQRKSSSKRSCMESKFSA